ncbi:MAG: hypothetical protein HOQ27_07870 [Dermatophilaceae bacterium]|nr:hypothetical protein [Dermatophilaceae bacterium]NUR79150.1 hypothetical protein [Dermatophilaceae bacterium]
MSAVDDGFRGRALDRRISDATPGEARRYAFGVARLACATSGLKDARTLEVALGGLERYPEIDDLAHLWHLERNLNASCAVQLGGDPTDYTHEELRLHPACQEARAVSAVIAAMLPDAFVAARSATREALAAGCRQADLDSTAADLL